MGWSSFRQVGLSFHKQVASVKGYTLVTPIGGDASYLLDMSGRIVHRWRHLLVRGFYARLLPDGSLIVMGTDVDVGRPEVPPGVVPSFDVAIRRIGGNATHILELDWDGNVTWQYENPTIHHDFVRLPNGNTLAPSFVQLPADLARSVRGGYRDAEKMPALISDDIIEVDRAGREVSRVHLWQLLDPRRDPICPLERRQEWTHTNSLDATPDGNILFSCRVNSRVGLIERGGGKLLWKYGAPNVHHQHHASVLANGHVQIFDNGMHRPGMPRSAVVEVDPKDSSRTWEYVSNPEAQFFSGHISGAERLAGDNVLVCEGAAGRVFEITRAGEVVWEWTSPFAVRLPTGQLNSWVFRAHRYSPDYAGLAGRELHADRHRDLNRMYGLERD